jgi:hypothetical protein
MYIRENAAIWMYKLIKRQWFTHLAARCLADRQLIMDISG